MQDNFSAIVLSLDPSLFLYINSDDGLIVQHAWCFSCTQQTSVCFLESFMVPWEMLGMNYELRTKSNSWAIPVMSCNKQYIYIKLIREYQSNFGFNHILVTIIKLYTVLSVYMKGEQTVKICFFTQFSLSQKVNSDMA